VKKKCRDIKRKIAFTIATKKYLGITVTKEVKGLNFKSYETWMTEIEEGTNEWKDAPCSWGGRTVKTLYYLKQSTDSMQSLSKFQCWLCMGVHTCNPSSREAEIGRS
jgi:hypothetical protein